MTPASGGLAGAAVVAVWVVRGSFGSWFLGSSERCARVRYRSRSQCEHGPVGTFGLCVAARNGALLQSLIGESLLLTLARVVKRSLS